MKLLSIAIPCYNSENYMRHAVETLLVGGEDVEIIITAPDEKDAIFQKIIGIFKASSGENDSLKINIQ